MTDEDFLNRMGEVMTEENSRPEGWWYLSFAGDPDFRGAAIVRGRGPVTAALTAKSFSANPGGEILAVPIGDMPIPAPRFRNKLLTIEQLREAFPHGVAHVTTEGNEYAVVGDL